MYAPVKEEVEWDEPRIIRYHDIISDREMEILKNISRPQVNTHTHTHTHTQHKYFVVDRIFRMLFLVKVLMVYYYYTIQWANVSGHRFQMNMFAWPLNSRED